MTKNGNGNGVDRKHDTIPVPRPRPERTRQALMLNAPQYVASMMERFDDAEDVRYEQYLDIHSLNAQILTELRDTNGKLDRLNSRLGKLEERMGKLESRVSAIEERVGTSESPEAS